MANENNNNWGMVWAFFAFAGGIVAAQWFSDNYHFEGNKIVHNDNADDSED
jgi:hypothetical protein